MPGTTNKFYTLRVLEEAPGRLDRFINLQRPELSRSRCARLVSSGWVQLNGCLAKPSSLLRRGDVVELIVPPPQASTLEPQDIPVTIVHENSHLIVIDKPAGLTVHPGPGHPDRTLVNAILAMIPDLPGIGDVQRPGIVHRLDKDTSGLMVIAKTEIAHLSLSRQLKDRRVRKLYTALVTGTITVDSDVITGPISRHPKHRKRMTVSPGGRYAHTSYRVLARYAGCTLIEVSLLTGRTHQIRVHFAHIGHPLVGDKTYGKSSDLVDRQFLHACRLGFFMPPEELDWQEFDSSLPSDLQQVLDNITPEQRVEPN